VWQQFSCTCRGACTAAGCSEKGGGVRSGPGAARTILLFHVLTQGETEAPAGLQTRSAPGQDTRSGQGALARRHADGPLCATLLKTTVMCKAWRRCTTLLLIERECCLLVLNLVSSTLPCIRRPRPRLRVLDVCGFVYVCTQAFPGF